MRVINRRLVQNNHVASLSSRAFRSTVIHIPIIAK